MTQTADLMFRCEVCGRRHVWAPDRAGQTFVCQCGEGVTVPAEAESELYDMAPMPVVPVQPAINRQTIEEFESSSVLSYQRPGARDAALEEQYSAANPMIVSVWRDMVLPISLIAVGTVTEFVWHSHITGSMATAVRDVGVGFVMNVVVMLIGVITAANVLDVSFGPVPTAILKLGAIAIGPGGFAVLIGAAIGGGIPGFLLGMAFSFGLYFGLFWYLFDLEAEDVWQTVLIIYGIRFASGLIWMFV
ncbi:MAG TPA: hypothetical protein VFE58_02260 [Tepidisphaeraceae bacterium]|jgi:hypothetical protein|nr:hypothetical protein [Tepidisphaeraceae bacterium]